MNKIDAIAYDWKDQARQHPQKGPRDAITHRVVHFPAGIYPDAIVPRPAPIDVFCYYDKHRHLRGILYHYRADVPPLERKGNVNVLVHPGFQRRGVGTRLVEYAREKVGPFNREQQDMTDAGLALARSLDRKRERSST